uniref:TAFH domain-containing protein n=1 Tax=Rhabditophanes sp. KR3021 TaxID=114890 RepID=A0AC35TFT5_9BILA
MSAPIAAVQQQSQMQETKDTSAKVKVDKCVRFFNSLNQMMMKKTGREEDIEIIKVLVNDVVNERSTPEDFTRDLQNTLGSSAQPTLVNFLKQALPDLRRALLDGTASIRGIIYEGGNIQNAEYTLPTRSEHVSLPHQRTTNRPIVHQQQPILPNNHFNDPNSPLPHQRIPNQPHPQNQQRVVNNMMDGRSNGSIASAHHPPNHHQQQYNSMNHSYSEGSQQQGTNRSTITPVSNYNDVDTGSNYSRDSVSSSSVTITSGSQQQHHIHQPMIPQQQFAVPQTISENVGSRSIGYRKHTALLNSNSIAARIAAKFPDGGQIDDRTVYAISHAIESRMRSLLCQLSIVAEHRLEKSQLNPFYVQTGDCRKQIKFLEDIAKKEHEKRENRERESILKAKKSKNKDDPEIKKAKQIQLADEAVNQANQANAAAMAALNSGNRNLKRAWADSNPHDHNFSSGFTTVATHRPRKKRVTVRDLQFIFDMDPALKRCRLKHRLMLSTTPTDSL